MKTTNTGLLNNMMKLNLLGLNKQLPDRGALAFETVAGSYARGVASDTSDLDLVGVFVPYYEQLYPYKVPGFGTQVYRPKSTQVPDLSVHLDGLGSMTVDVLAMDVVHLFNMLLKPSPNHVEYLFFNHRMMNYSTAGSYLVQHRDMFLTQAFVSKCVALGCSVLYKNTAKTQKDYAFAMRFFSYASQAVKHGTLDPDLFRETNLMVLGAGLDTASRMATVYMEEAKKDEDRVVYLPTTLDEEKANDVLQNVLRLHWAERSVLDYVNG